MSKLTEDQLEAREMLREALPKGADAYTILRHVSDSGMTRAISVVVVSEGVIRSLDHLIIRAGLEKRHPKYEGLKIGGTGMDMGFHVVYSLSRAIHEDGYAINQRWL